MGKVIITLIDIEKHIHEWRLYEEQINTRWGNNTRTIIEHRTRKWYCIWCRLRENEEEEEEKEFIKTI